MGPPLDAIRHRPKKKQKLNFFFTLQLLGVSDLFVSNNTKTEHKQLIIFQKAGF